MNNSVGRSVFLWNELNISYYIYYTKIRICQKCIRKFLVNRRKYRNELLILPNILEKVGVYRDLTDIILSFTLKGRLFNN